jgi:hypothetical protein
MSTRLGWSFVGGSIAPQGSRRTPTASYGTLLGNRMLEHISQRLGSHLFPFWVSDSDVLPLPPSRHPDNGRWGGVTDEDPA